MSKIIKVLFGEQENVDWNKADIDWNAIDSQLISRRIAVTRNRVNGVKLGSLRLRNLYGINITRVNRAGIDLLASPDLRLQIGDRLTIVGEANSVNTVGKILGDEIKRLNNPNLLAVFIGISLGMLLGALPITLPGMSTPVKLGIAGGPIIVGILMGAFGPRFHLATYTTMSANLMLRQLGIIIYLVGIGDRFGCTFLRNGFSGRRIALDRAWISADDRAGADRRFHSFAIFQTRLCAQRGYALREHGKPDGTELCQHDCRWRRTLRFLCHRLSAFNVYPRDFSTIGADVIHLIDQALEHLTSTFSPSTKVVAKR